MDARETQRTVLARIPDLNANDPDDGAKANSGRGLPTSVGRLINQAASFKLLAGIAALLLVGAVFIGHIPSTDPAPTADTATAWRTEPTSVAASGRQNSGGTTAATPQRFESILASANAPRGEKAVAPKTVMNKPATLIPATPQRSQAPAMVPPLEVARDRQPGRPTETPLMSEWPNPMKR
jgi:hypothetical protein